MKQSPSIDEIKLHYSGVFLITDTGRLIGQLRDTNPSIDYPGTISAFGGAMEPGEQPLDAAWRELSIEETNIGIEKEDIHHFDQIVSIRPKTNEWQVMDYFYAYISDELQEKLQIYEGQGWVFIDNPQEPKLIEELRPVVKKLFAIVSP